MSATVDDEEVELAPAYVHEELLDEAVLLGATPDDRIVVFG